MSESACRVAIVPGGPGFAETLALAAAQGFSHVEIEGLIDRPMEHLSALADTGLFVACVRLGQGLGDEAIETRRQLLERQKRMVSDAARLGASMAYLTLPVIAGESAIAHFREGCTLLSAFAAGRGVRLLVLVEDEAKWTWLPEGIDLVLQDPEAEQVRRAGARLGYVRLQGHETDTLTRAGYEGKIGVRPRDRE